MLVKYTVSEFLSAKGSFSSIDGMQSFGKTLVDLYKHDFCITESYFQN